jgi:uncharacterized protein YqeY
MENRIQKDIATAMKAKDEVTLMALRSVKTAIMQYKTSPNFKGNRDENLVDTDIIKIMQKMVKERKETADVYKNAGRLELANKELSEANVIEGYLPKQLTEDEVEVMVREAITEVNATSIKDMGKVIASVNSKANGRTDGKTISAIVKRILAC